MMMRSKWCSSISSTTVTPFTCTLARGKAERRISSPDLRNTQCCFWMLSPPSTIWGGSSAFFRPTKLSPSSRKCTIWWLNMGSSCRLVRCGVVRFRSSSSSRPAPSDSRFVCRSALSFSRSSHVFLFSDSSRSSSSLKRRISSSFSRSNCFRSSSFSASVMPAPPAPPPPPPAPDPPFTTRAASASASARACRRFEASARATSRRTSFDCSSASALVTVRSHSARTSRQLCPLASAQ
mmetsp:Transcript_29454/g.96139  ORF Transcript_29454/g.96139 Transcript_29454/m.96139 type:complete len:237 (+) Transcript_29454:1554-2264(+)